MPESDEREWQERLGLEAANLPGFYTFPRPEPGFSTLSASPEELTRYGVPTRPDPDVDPAAFRRWRGLYGRITEFVEPQLRERSRLRDGTLAGVSEVAEEGTASLPNWAGHVLVAADGQTFTAVGGMWVVPSVSRPSGGPFADGNEIGIGLGNQARLWNSSAWVGIDGADGIGRVTSKDLFQAGTEHDLVDFDLFGQQQFRAGWSMWTEWVPQLSATVGGMSVSPGDLVSVEMQIIARQPNVSVGVAWLLNLTSGAFVPVSMAGPGTNNRKGTSFVGDSAEWIVETPGIGTPPVLSELPYLGIVGFFQTFAIDSTGASVSGATGTTTTDVSPNLYAVSMENSSVGPGRTGTNAGAVVAKPDEKAFGVQTLF